MQTEVDTKHIPEIFERFAALVPPHHAKQQREYVVTQLKRNPLLQDWLAEEYDTALALDECFSLQSERGQLFLSGAELQRLYSAIAFATQTVSVVNAVAADEKRKFAKRVHDAIKNTVAMRALRLELVVATHFLRRGIRITWPEVEGIGRFDLLLNDLGPRGLEVECKAISRDTGRKIPRWDAQEFNNQIFTRIKSIGQQLEVGLSVVVTIPGNLPTSVENRRHLGETVTRQILIGQSSVLADGTDIRIEQFDVNRLISHNAHDIAIDREAIDRVTRTENRECLVVGRRDHGAIVVVLQSAADDRHLKAMFNTLSESAKTQLSRTRPAIFAVGLQGISYDSLRETAAQDFDPRKNPTELRNGVSKFLSSQERDYVVGVAFLSDGERRFQRDTTSTRETGADGTAYYFPKRTAPMWHEHFSGLFDSS